MRWRGGGHLWVGMGQVEGWEAPIGGEGAGMGQMEEWALRTGMGGTHGWGWGRWRCGHRERGAGRGETMGGAGMGGRGAPKGEDGDMENGDGWWGGG